MLKFLSALVLGAFAIGAAPAHAQTMLITGRCVSKLMLGQDLTAACQPYLTHSIQGENIVFSFRGAQGSSASFVGRDLPNPTRDSDLMNLISVQLNIPGYPPAPQRAEGTCLYTNPYQGPATVQCSGRMLVDGQWMPAEAVFLTDGTPPVIQ